VTSRRKGIKICVLPLHDYCPRRILTQPNPLNNHRLSHVQTQGGESSSHGGGQPMTSWFLNPNSDIQRIEFRIVLSLHQSAENDSKSQSFSDGQRRGENRSADSGDARGKHDLEDFDNARWIASSLFKIWF